MELLNVQLHLDEQEMDFLILEELACSPPFAEWFMRQTGYEQASASSLLRLGRSVSAYNGETDLLVVHSTALGKRALLMESKVGAGFTSFQPERYRTRGQAGIDAGNWQEFITVLMAPQSYLDGASKYLFNYTVPYEKIKHAVAAYGDPKRVAFKLHILDLAITKAKESWRPIVSPEVTAFFRGFRNFAVPRLPEIPWPSEANSRPAGSTWVQIRIPPLPSRVLIEVKPDSGIVDLRLFGVPEGILRGSLDRLPVGADTAPAAKSSAVRLRTPKMKVRSPFEGQEAEAGQHLAAVRTLAAFARQEVKKLFTLLGDPRTSWNSIAVI
jgi:hypothetical protein